MKNRVAKKFRKLRDRTFEKLKRSKIESILSSSSPADTSKADVELPSLLAKTKSREINYGYAPIDLWHRAIKRCNELLTIDTISDPGKRVLDIGCGDGMLGCLLDAFGHDVELIDMEDWRCEQAKTVKFTAGKVDGGTMAFPDNSFDLLVSYNVFEHLDSPQACFNDAARLLKPGGVLFISVNPIFNCDWGYHAYRAVPIPYCQHLFDRELLNEKIREIGIQDLGRELTDPQSLNEWKWSEFSSLFSSEPRLELIDLKLQKSIQHLKWILEFPNSFQGRGLSYDDVSVAGFQVTLRKKSSREEN